MPAFHRSAIWGLALILITMTACQMALAPPTPTVSPSPAPVIPDVSSSAPATEDAVPRITAGELKAKLDSGKDVVIVDTRNLENFNKKHIPGAISMPLVEVDLRYEELPKGKTIVLYCT